MRLKSYSFWPLQTERYRQRQKAPALDAIRFHTNLPQLYQDKIEKLGEALEEPAIRNEAVTLLRDQIIKFEVYPGDGFE